MKKSIKSFAYFSMLIVTLGLAACNQEKKQEETKSENTATSQEEKGNLIQPTAANTEEKRVNNDPNAPVIAFENTEFNFGEINAGEKVKHVFKFKNTGKTPLILQSCQPSCGCTVPDCPKDPVASGQEGKIAIEFDSSNKSGVVNKTVTITANTNPSTVVLTIKGNIKTAVMDGPVRQ